MLMTDLGNTTWSRRRYTDGASLMALGKGFCRGQSTYGKRHLLVSLLPFQASDSLDEGSAISLVLGWEVITGKQQAVHLEHTSQDNQPPRILFVPSPCIRPWTHLCQIPFAGKS